MSSLSDQLKRLAVIFSIIFLIAGVHIFRLGSYLQGDLYNLYYSYFSDLILPFGCYFLICAEEMYFPFLRHWEVKLALAFGLPAIPETCQYFGLPVLGITFDPLDYLMYAIGALAAVVVDTQVFSRLFGFWCLETAKR
jgi:hypothetical protein